MLECTHIIELSDPMNFQNDLNLNLLYFLRSWRVFANMTIIKLNPKRGKQGKNEQQ
jgi:hypothetical protein